MTLIEIVKEGMEKTSSPGKLHIINDFSILEVYPDGIALFHKMAPTRYTSIPMSRADLEYMQHFRLPIRQFPPGEPEHNLDVHTEHCCIVHGCKYRDADCTVETGQKRQSGACQIC